MAERNDDLRLFAQLGDSDAVRHQLVKGADIDDVDDEGNTALLLAVRGNCGETVQLLLRHGAGRGVCARTCMRLRKCACVRPQYSGGICACCFVFGARSCPATWGPNAHAHLLVHVSSFNECVHPY